MMPPAAYRMLAVQTERLLSAKTDEARFATRRLLVKLALHFSGLTPGEQERAATRIQLTCITTRPEVYALTVLAIIEEARRDD